VDSQGTRLLVIGYGNELRRDDGVGPKVAASVAEWNLPRVLSLAVHQLTPELADPIALADRVIFVDASTGPAESVQMREIEPNDSLQIITHAADPRSLLALAKRTFGRCPCASWLSIPARDLEFGAELSPMARKGLGTALEELRKIADEISR
jgi:hydrogenase maturation protease